MIVTHRSIEDAAPTDASPNDNTDVDIDIDLMATTGAEESFARLEAEVQQEHQQTELQSS